MPKFTLRISQRVFYEVEVEASDAAHARQQWGQGDNPPDLIEVDSGLFEVEDIFDGRGHNEAEVARRKRIARATVIAQSMAATHYEIAHALAQGGDTGVAGVHQEWAARWAANARASLVYLVGSEPDAT